MANYNKSVNFAVKDTLQSGDPNKIVSGAEIDTEFNNVSSSSTTKIDKVSAATAGNLPTFTATGGIQDSGETLITVAPPSGSITMFAADSAPSGWLECNGAEVSRITQSTLFSVIGTTFGIGDGSTTFNLPDLRGEFIRGWDNTRGVDSGRSFGSSQSDELRAHRHLIKHSFDNGNVNSEGGYPSSDQEIWSGKYHKDDAMDFEGGSETRPRNVALMYIIKT